MASTLERLIHLHGKGLYDITASSSIRLPGGYQHTYARNKYRIWSLKEGSGDGRSFVLKQHLRRTRNLSGSSKTWRAAIHPCQKHVISWRDFLFHSFLRSLRIYLKLIYDRDNGTNACHQRNAERKSAEQIVEPPFKTESGDILPR